jgi:MFS family permease
VWLLVLFTVAGFIETFFFGQLGAFTPLYLPHLGIAPEDVAAWVGIMGAVTGIIGIPFLPFWGALADRYARQPVIVRSFVAHLLAIIGMLIARNIWVFVIARSITSLALGNTGLMMATLSERAPPKRLGFAFSILNGAPPLGAFIGPLIGGIVIDKQGFPSLLAVNGVLMLGVILALAFGYHDNYRGTNRGPLLGMAADSVRIIVQSPRLRTLFIALFALFSGWMMVFTYASLAILARYQGPDPGAAVGLVLGAGGLTTLVISPLIGVLADRFGRWRVLFIGAGLAVFLWPLPLFTTNLLSYGVAWAMINGLVSGVFALSFAVLSTSASDDVRGRVMSFAYLPLNVGGTLGPALGSIITRNSIFAIFPAAAMLTALGVGVLWLAYRQMVKPAPIEVSQPAA